MSLRVFEALRVSCYVPQIYRDSAASCVRCLAALNPMLSASYGIVNPQSYCGDPCYEFGIVI